MKKLFLLCLFLLIPVLAFPATLTLNWANSTGATGYRIYQCTVAGGVGPWTLNKDVPGGAIITTTVTVPDSGPVYLKIHPYNAVGEMPRPNAGVWYRGDLSLPSQGTDLGIQ